MEKVTDRACAKVSNFAALDNIIECSHYFLAGSFAIEPMNLKDVQIST
jgi:hypothetical protein